MNLRRSRISGGDRLKPVAVMPAPLAAGPVAQLIGHFTNGRRQPRAAPGGAARSATG
jgi:hypothetical protein